MLRAITVTTRGGRRADRSRYAGDFGRLESRSGLDLSSWRPAGVEREILAAFVPGQSTTRTDCGRRSERSHAAARLSHRRQRSRPEGGRRHGLRRVRPRTSPRVDDETFAVTAFWHVGGHKAFVDFQNDVTADDIALSEREGFRSVEHLKRYTTLGMATDQGKLSNVNGLAIMAALDRPSDPGRRNDKLPAAACPDRRRRTRRPSPRQTISAVPARRRHISGRSEQGTVFVETGAWLRAQYFPRSGEKDWLETVSREVRTVRSAVGFCDVSTLGKIEVHGAGCRRLPRSSLHQHVLEPARSAARAMG